MRTDLVAYRKQQVFLNYPFDDDFEPLADAMHFAVAAGGLIPVCAKDLSVPDRPRLEMLVDAIDNCRYSAHDFSRFTGEGDKNLARFNAPIEMGMALFNALKNQRQTHRCAFFVSTPHDYHIFASDLAGLDPKHHGGDEITLVSHVYQWLRDVVSPLLFSRQPIAEVAERYAYFKDRMTQLKGSGPEGQPNHDEKQELMYTICAECGWWDWRETKAGQIEFPALPLAWKE